MPVIDSGKTITNEEWDASLPKMLSYAEEVAYYEALKNKKVKPTTKKAIKMLMKEVESEVIPKKIKSKKIDKLLKDVEVKVKKDSTKKEIKKLIQDIENVKPNYISTKEVEDAIKDMEHHMLNNKLTKEEKSYAKMKAKLIADKMKADPAIIPILRTQLLKYNYPIIHAFFMGYPDLFKELYPKTDVLQGRHKEFMAKFDKEEKKEIKKKATKEKAVAVKAEKKALKEKFSKTKGLNEEEIKKYNQAKAYINRITSPSVGKHPPLNDPDLVSMIAHECLDIGFTKMSEKLFLKAYSNVTGDDE
jgi:hypothetical protein